MVMINKQFWLGKRVLITGCTGFKGSWLTVWLNGLGAKIYGYSLTPPTNPSMWEDMQLENLCENVRYADIRDYASLKQFIVDTQPEIIIHMAAQPLVRYSYSYPRETYEVNVMGTVNLLDAVRETNDAVKAVVNVTTDKCYENKEWIWAYRENEPMGGYDPYSNSKGCSELVTSSFVNSYFNQAGTTAVGSGRAGNVIGGGDWADDRLIPDIIRSFSQNKEVFIRYPHAVRPWQHVLEPLSGYLLLAEKLYTEGQHYSGGWNFGPLDNDTKTVEQIVRQMCSIWGNGASWVKDSNDHPHEANLLRLDCSKARMLLGWNPVWNSEVTLNKLIAWYKKYFENKNMLEITQQQIKEYMKDVEC